MQGGVWVIVMVGMNARWCVGDCDGEAGVDVMLKMQIRVIQG